MASFEVFKPRFVMLIFCMVVLSPHAKAAVTCGQVAADLSACIPYLVGAAGDAALPACCSGVKSLNDAAKTTADRQTACNCIKTASANMPGINFGLAESLPRKCGVDIPYKISPSTDCSSVK